MRYEFYVQTEERYVRDISNKHITRIKDEIDHKDIYTQLDEVKHARLNVSMQSLIEFIPYNEHKLTQTIEDLDGDALKSSNKVEINGIKFNIEDIVYDVDNSIVKCYLGGFTFEGADLSDEHVYDIMVKAKNNYIKELDKLVMTLEYAIEKYESEAKKPKNGLFRRLFS